MFAYLYHICIAIFLLQGILSPLLLIVLGFVWSRQNKKLELLRKQLQPALAKNAKSDSDVSEILERLPKLEPLNCTNCGAGVLLQESGTLCPNCQRRDPLPADYAAAGPLKTDVARILKSATRHWRVANILTLPAVRWFFFLMIFAEPFVIFPSVLIGSNLYPNSVMDRAFGVVGETVSFLIILSAFLGFIVWMIVFIMLWSLSKSLRKHLPVVPVFAEMARGKETASCESCGGAIAYDTGAFASICGYCNVVNFRVAFARRERLKAKEHRTESETSLFGAMKIIEDFVGMLFFLLLILIGACVLLSIFYAVKNLS